MCRSSSATTRCRSSSDARRPGSVTASGYNCQAGSRWRRQRHRHRISDTVRSTIAHLKPPRDRRGHGPVHRSRSRSARHRADPARPRQHLAPGDRGARAPAAHAADAGQLGDQPGLLRRCARSLAQLRPGDLVRHQAAAAVPGDAGDLPAHALSVQPALRGAAADDAGGRAHHGVDHRDRGADPGVRADQPVLPHLGAQLLVLQAAQRGHPGARRGRRAALPDLRHGDAQPPPADASGRVGGRRPPSRWRGAGQGARARRCRLGRGDVRPRGRQRRRRGAGAALVGLLPKMRRWPSRPRPPRTPLPASGRPA